MLSPVGDAKRYSYAFAASEVGRLHDLFVDRSQVRHWAIQHGVQAPARMPRPPAYAASEGLTGETPLEDVNDHLGCLIDYRNGFEKHRDLGDTPLHAWESVVKGGRCKIRQPPTDGWWELIWSEWKGMAIGPRGRLAVGDTLCTTECANGTRVWCCHHLDGTISLVMNKPKKGTGPKIVFTNNPKIRKCR